MTHHIAFLKPYRLISLANLILMMSTSAWANEFKIFTLSHRFASDIAPIIAPMVDQSGTMSAVQNQLIIRTDPTTMRQIEAIVQSLDTPIINRKVSFSFNRQNDNESGNTALSGNIRRGNISIGNDRGDSPNSGRVLIERNTTQHLNSTTQFVNVQDGQTAFIRVGQLVPFTQEWVTLTQRYTHIQTNTTFQEVSTGFAVQPMSLNHQVTLTIHPRIATLNNRQTIDFEELSTTINIPLGEWVNLGGMLQQQDEISRRILGSSQQQSSQHSGFWIKVE